VVEGLDHVGKLSLSRLSANMLPRFVDFIEQPVVADRSVDRPQEEDVRRVLDLAGGVRRSESEIGDNRVAAVGRIDLALGATDELLVLPDPAERASRERR
jgi:hypothetical protein